MKADFLNISQAQLKRWARLGDSKFRHAEGIFIAEGVKIVEELLSSDWQVGAILVLPEKTKYWKNLMEKVDSDIPVYQMADAQWNKFSQDKEPEGIMAIVQIKPEPTLISLLSTSPENVLFCMK